MTEPEIKRLDPPDCGCTDCLTGFSKPISEATQDELADCYVGRIENASSMKLVPRFEYEPA